MLSAVGWFAKAKQPAESKHPLPACAQGGPVMEF